MRRIKFAALVGAVICIGLLHHLTPGHETLYHDMYRRLGYFPIVIGGLWFGLWGGLSIAFLSAIAFIPHLYNYVCHYSSSCFSEFTEIVLYVAAGAVTGGIAGREAKLREKYKVLSEKLEKSYSRLHEETELLLEVEEQLAASQRFSALGRLSASLAHEIKNPLASIRGTGEILMEEFPDDHPKREFGEILLKEVGRLDATVQEVLKYARGGDVDQPEEKEAMTQVVMRVVKLLESQLKKKSITLDIHGEEAGNEFHVPESKMTQVFLNLVLNSIDVLENGGTILVEMRSEEKGIIAAVCDNGPGVPEKNWEKVFAPFYSGRTDGTGLGLSISRKIVESYQGKLTCSEGADGGACFTVFLPQRVSPCLHESEECGDQKAE